MRQPLLAPLLLLIGLGLVAPSLAQGKEPAQEVDLAGSFTFRAEVRWEGEAPADLPLVVGNKDWEGGEVQDYTTNNAYGLGRESGSLAGFAISVLPDGAWTWNAGDGSRRLDHRPEAADQGLADGAWHSLGFAVDREQGVVHLVFDGVRVALHDLQGLGSLASGQAVTSGSAQGLSVRNVRLEPGVDPGQPRGRADWDGEPLKVLAWNIWHGGRRKGRDEGVQRVVEVIQECGADIVLMQETYGSGPRISGRLGFDYYLRSSNLSVMSRFPITEVHRLFQGFRFGGATVELRTGTPVEVHSLWIHHLPDVGKALAEGATGEQLAAADQETRGSEMDGILAVLMKHLDARPAVPVLVGGDFNSGSHLDWTAEAADLPNHLGRVVPWPVSLAMERAGFVDTFRVRHPDPITMPGHTWSPEFTDDHQDRIDYVYARAGDCRVLDSVVLNSHPRGWPSDHAAVLSTLELLPPPRDLRVLSYNIHYGVGMDGATDLERIARVIRDQQPDLVGLQEIGSRAMAEELGRLTGMDALFGPSKGSDEAYGDAVLSKLPMTLVGSEPLPSASSSRYQAMAVDVDLPTAYGDDARLRFVNTHFDWTDSLGSQEARRAAAQVIERAFLQGLEHPALLAGDLNAVPDSAPLQDLAEDGWHLPGLGQPMLTWGAPNPEKQIDYVLTRPGLGWRVRELRVIDEPVASDHYPVLLVARPVR